MTPPDKPAPDPPIDRLLGGERFDPATTERGLAVLQCVFAGFDTLRDAAALPSRPDLHASGDRLGAWRLQRLLGSGGMGDVWLAERCDGQVEQRVAIKCVRSARASLGERMVREQRLLARLEHPGIARFLDAGRDAHGLPYLVMEYIEGDSIDAYCDAAVSDRTSTLTLFLRVCAAVEYAHRQLVVHRDLKPGNILVGSDDMPKLLDFGIAKYIEADVESAPTTVPALTLAYSAPELLRGDPVSAATDVFSLGLILHRLLCGSLPPVRVAAPLAQLAGIERDWGDAPASGRDGRPLPRDLRAILAQALRGAPSRRYGSAADFADDIHRHLDALPVRARPATRGYRLRRFLRRNALVVSATTIALLALSIGALLALGQAREARLAAEQARNEALSSERVSEFAVDLLRELNPQGRNGAALKPPERIITDAIAAARRDLADDPLARANLLNKLAELQSQIGVSADAKPVAEEALAIFRSELGATHPETANVLVTVGTIQRHLGDLAGARAALEEAAAIFVLHEGYTGYTIMTLSRLGAIASQLGQPSQALEFLDRARALAPAHYGTDHPHAIELDGNRAMLLDQLGRLEEAEAAHRATIAAFERSDGPMLPRLMPPLVRLGVNLTRRGRSEEGLAAIDRGLAIGRAAGADNPLVIDYAISRAEVLRLLGRAAESEQDLAALDPSLVARRPVTERRVLLLQGRIALDRGDPASALVALDAAHAISAAIADPGSEVAHAIACERIRALMALDRWDLAEAALSAQSAQDAAAPELAALSLADNARLEARVLAHAGRHADALAAQRRAQTLVLQIEGTSSPLGAVLRAEFDDLARIAAGREARTPGD